MYGVGMYQLTTGKPAGLAKAPVVFLVLIVIIVAGLVIIGRLGPTEGVGDNQQGEVSFTEDFTGETLASLEAQGWSAWDKPYMLKEITGSAVNFSKETISVTDDGTLKANGAGGLMYSKNWSDYTLTFKFKAGGSGGNFWWGLAFRCDATWSSGVRQNGTVTDNGSWPQNSYILQLSPGGGIANNIYLRKIVGGTWTQITSVENRIESNVWHTAKLEAHGSSLNVYLDDNLILSVTDSSLTSGGIGLLNCTGPVYFDDVLVS